MNICVISPKGCTESAQELAKALGAKYSNPYRNDRFNYGEFDKVFNYGCGKPFMAKSCINNSPAVRRCIDKLDTFQTLKAANIPIPAFAVRKRDVPKTWETVVARKTATGCKNEGMELYEQGCVLPDAALYTEYFPHKYEYRVVVFMGKVVARYRKDLTKQETWKFTLMHKQGFEQVDNDCVSAAAALEIDYVGFDIIENKKGQYVFLEANSGPILTPEVMKAIVKHFK